MATKKQQTVDEALAQLQAEFNEKRRQILKEQKKELRSEREATVAEAKKMITKLRRKHTLTDTQIIKRLGLSIEPAE